MVDTGKAIRPVESVVLAPLNEGDGFKSNSYITFRIGASDLNMWLTNDSYLSFDYEIDADVAIEYENISGGELADGTKCALPGIYIRNACNVFRQIEVVYGGKTIYAQPYNIEQNTIRMLSYGESYLNSNYATYTTNKMVADGTAHLGFAKSTTIAGALANNTKRMLPVAARGVLIKNIMIPINQLIPLFEDVTADGFPVRNLKSQIEIRLYVADANRYLTHYDGVKKDFANNNSKSADKKLKLTGNLEAFNSVSKLKTVRMYCSSYVPDEANAHTFDSKCNDENGWSFHYSLWQIALRQESDIKPSNILPFNVVTENTKSFISYCYSTGYSPSVMIRPEIKSVQLTFGSNHIPKQPISGSSFEFPFDYKFTVDDVLDNIDKYYAESNMDYNYSYRTIPAGKLNADIEVPTSQFVILGANYTNTDQMGGNSSSWNSQYQLHFDSVKAASTPAIADPLALTFVLGVNSEFGLTVKAGDMDTINL